MLIRDRLSLLADQHSRKGLEPRIRYGPIMLISTAFESPHPIIANVSYLERAKFWR